MRSGIKSRSLTRPKITIQRIIERLEKIHPDAKLDLDYSNPLELLIALILAAQARDELVRQITPQLFAKYRSAQDYAKTPLTQLQRDIGKINFYRNKSRSIRNCCTELVKRFGGRVPDSLEDLLSLPGVGRKTANVLLGNAFGKQTIGVDTHVMRLSQRIGLTAETDPEAAEHDLSAMVPETHRVRFCHLLQYHGRRICIARKPKCAECNIVSLCLYRAKTT
ncbi:MAG TPA: endonuclease III [Candidatus Polarisedimenticolaceae bacterium]|nr:endonuclease III [Candidatus Polarisedimenticolaceae bacterium]